MAPKHTTLQFEEFKPILNWMADRDVEEVAKAIGCSKSTLYRNMTYSTGFKGWRFPTDRLAKIKELMK